ncbi:hypothetical protein LC593_03865 [Nostoc sp. CHAB 5844]|nr:hypothetical protein [Nostoc sp. CHAB 5844]
MIVVCDTSPLCYLILIDCVEILPQLFSRITIPNAVCTELLAEGSYIQVQNWIAKPPSWLEIQTNTPLYIGNLGKIENGIVVVTAYGVIEDMTFPLT